MLYITIFVALLVALSVTAYLVLPVRRLAIAKGWTDNPDGMRKLHKRSVPSLGGVAIAGGILAGFLVLTLLEPVLGFGLNALPAAFWIAALLIFGVGFYDDVRGADFKVKILFQLAAGYLLLHAGFRVDLSGFSLFGLDGYSEALYSIPLTLLWVVGIINAVNLIDGLDGLAGGVMAIAFGALALIFGMQGEIALVLFAIPIIGALLGFLFHNSNPASVFMGDSGSLVLGFLIAAYSLQAPVHAHPGVALLIPVVVLGVPVTDTALSIVRRLTERKAVCAPDHDHIHHRLSRHWPVHKAVLILYAAAAWFGTAAALMSIATPLIALMILVMTTLAAVMGLRTLGYLRIRNSLATWRQVRIQNSRRTVESQAGKDALSYLRLRPVAVREAPVSERKASTETAPERPKVDLNSSDGAHASAA